MLVTFFTENETTVQLLIRESVSIIKVVKTPCFAVCFCSLRNSNAAEKEKLQDTGGEVYEDW